MTSGADKPFNLTCWYINQRRLMELVGPAALAQRLDGYQNLGEHQRTLATFAAYKSLAIDCIKSKAVEPLGTSLLREQVIEGCLFTHYSQFWFKGLSKLHPDAKNRRQKGIASGYAKLDDFEPALRLEFSFHPEHLTSTTAWGEMSGSKRKFFFGAIQNSAPGRLTAIPYIVGDVLAGSESFVSAGYWLNHREIHIDSIDTFNKVADYRPNFTQKSLDALKAIPEEAIKGAFAEIIGEPTVPKDWGGERSDLFSTQVRIAGRRTSTAFAFKGPSKFRPMTMAELGKNGDQIDRLYTEPAELLVLQHCHEVTHPVRAAMRAYAERVGNPRLFCIIDGYDTLRVLQTYRKCGFATTSASPHSQEVA